MAWGFGEGRRKVETGREKVAEEGTSQADCKWERSASEGGPYILENEKRIKNQPAAFGAEVTGKEN